MHFSTADVVINWGVISPPSLSVVSIIGFAFSIWVGLVSPSFDFVNIARTGGVLRMSNYVVNVRLGMLFESTLLLGVLLQI